MNTTSINTMTNDQLMSSFFDLIDQMTERGIRVPKLDIPQSQTITTITKKVNMILVLNGMTGQEIGKYPLTKKTFESFDIEGYSFKNFQDDLKKKGTISKAIKVNNNDRRVFGVMSIIEVESKDVPKTTISTNKSGGGKDKPCKMYDRVLDEVSYWPSVRNLVNNVFKGGDASYHNLNARENTELGIDVVRNENAIYMLNKRYAIQYI